MPIYEYQCLHCGKSFDVLQRMTDHPLRKCPSCGHRRIRKQFSVPVVHTRARTSIAQHALPGLTGRSALDGTRPLHWPTGRLVGVKPDQTNK